MNKEQWQVKHAQKRAEKARQKVQYLQWQKLQSATGYFYKSNANDLAYCLDNLGEKIFALREYLKSYIAKFGNIETLRHNAYKVELYAKQSGMAGLNPLDEKWFVSLIETIGMIEDFTLDRECNGILRMHYILFGSK